MTVIEKRPGRSSEEHLTQPDITISQATTNIETDILLF